MAELLTINSSIGFSKNGKEKDSEDYFEIKDIKPLTEKELKKLNSNEPVYMMIGIHVFILALALFISKKGISLH